MDHIFTLRQILEKQWEFNKPVHQLFVDFSKAYDSVLRDKMYEILSHQEIPGKYIRLNGSKGRVRVGRFISDEFTIRNGLKQGDALSPLLFNLALDYVVKEVAKNKVGLDLGGKISILGLADDMNLRGRVKTK